MDLRSDPFHCGRCGAPLLNGAPVELTDADFDRAVVPVHDAPDDLGIVTLGGKAFMLRQLHLLGLNVPPAFVFTWRKADGNGAAAGPA